jgi:phosphotransferase system IIB component
MDEDKKKEQLTQQEVSKRARVMGVFSHDAQTFSFVFHPKKKEEKKKKIVDLFSFS